MTAIITKLAEAFKETPVILGLLVFNLLVLSAFWLTLGKIGEAAVRRDALLEKCISQQN